VCGLERGSGTIIEYCFNYEGYTLLVVFYILLIPLKHH